MATNFTLSDAMTSIAGGALDEVMRRRKLREQQQQQLLLQQNQLQATQQNLATQQAGATERTRLEQQGMTTRDANNPKTDPMADYENKLRIRYKVEKELGVGAYAPKAPKGSAKEANDAADEKGLSAQVKRLTDAWSRDVENRRMGNFKTDEFGRPTKSPQTHLVGSRSIPMVGGQELPQDKWDEVAQTSILNNITPQKAADMIYAKDSADQAGSDYGISPFAQALDVNRLRELPSMHGRSLNIGDENGTTNLYELMGALMAKAGWSQQEMSDLLDEYFGVSKTPPMVSPEMQNAIRNPMGQ